MTETTPHAAVHVARSVLRAKLVRSLADGGASPAEAELVTALFDLAFAAYDQIADASAALERIAGCLENIT